MTETSTYPRMETIPTAKLRKNAANPNEQDERTFNALCQSIQDEGWVEPMATAVPAGDGFYDIVGGHHRHDAATVLGIEDGPVWLLDPEKFDKDRQNWTMVKVNILKGKLNPSKFTALYQDMVAVYGAEVLQAQMGFTSEDAFKSLYQDVRRNLPPELAKALDGQKEEIKTIDDLSLVLNRLFREHGETLPSNMMVFSFGGKDVLWVRADKQLWDAVTTVAKDTAKEGEDMNERMKRIMLAGLKSIEQEAVSA
ncbi:ParB-like partition nuclease [Arthrobacter phage KellEzio]|uniref:ParB-like nuclease domain protein n=2 Tax=Kelleziovirus TaxID=1982236 RepID=A0A140G6H7_9CAUD|nr:ParB-like partition nuclease [Arthrobacter phage KellEzio]AMM44262.1 ParB-like nuclease domain protein [Arthrobacter phage KellEzio]QGJ96533.1 ParB-like nuclease domain protein [Arthrobacter phage BeatusComedenti]